MANRTISVIQITLMICLGTIGCDSGDGLGSLRKKSNDAISILNDSKNSMTSQKDPCAEELSISDPELCISAERKCGDVTSVVSIRVKSDYSSTELFTQYAGLAIAKSWLRGGYMNLQKQRLKVAEECFVYGIFEFSDFSTFHRNYPEYNCFTGVESDARSYIVNTLNSHPLCGHSEPEHLSFGANLSLMIYDFIRRNNDILSDRADFLVKKKIPTDQDYSDIYAMALVASGPGIVSALWNSPSLSQSRFNENFSVYMLSWRGDYGTELTDILMINNYDDAINFYLRNGFRILAKNEWPFAYPH